MICKDCGVLAPGKYQRCIPCRTSHNLAVARVRQRKVAVDIKRARNRAIDLSPKRKAYKLNKHKLRREALYELYGVPMMCAICEDAFTEDNEAHWDHRHGSKEFRGWLCHRCNVSLGLLGDNPVLLERAAAYLRYKGFSPTRGPSCPSS